MGIGSILVLAGALAMDAAAVAMERGIAAERVRLRHVLLVGALFGGFQAAMPILGWLLGSRIGPMVEAWDHWIAFAILGALGGKSIWEALRGQKAEDAAKKGDVFGLRVLLVLAVATSIDALAAGFTLPMMGAPPAATFATIGVVTAVLSGAGVVVGKRLGPLFGERIHLIGGLVLVALGVKILVEHLSR
ncbi:MAG: manganese efflux pump MntP family protein [Polyangiaceae bacterium]